MYTMLYNKQQQITKDLDDSIVRLLDYLNKKLSMKDKPGQAG
jgi:hypothetical protein